jgi:hypothetical protein
MRKWQKHCLTGLRKKAFFSKTNTIYGLEKKMNVIKLCEMIDMPSEVTQKIEKMNVEQYKEALDHYWILLQNKIMWDAAVDG